MTWYRNADLLDGALSQPCGREGAAGAVRVRALPGAAAYRTWASTGRGLQWPGRPCIQYNVNSTPLNTKDNNSQKLPINTRTEFSVAP